MFMVVLRLSEEKGRSPVSISYIRTPKDHQSAVWSWPRRETTSGAMYSTVPQNENVLDARKGGRKGKNLNKEKRKGEKKKREKRKK